MKKVLYFLTIAVGLLFTSCGGDEDEPELKFEDKTISYGQTYTIPNGQNIVWSSSNELIATVNGNTVTAQKVGEAVISSDKGSFKVTVNPTSYVFVEPCLQWNASKNTIKSYMNSVTGVTQSEETDTKINYTGTGKVVLYNYTFENNGLDGSGIALNGDYVDTDAMSTFMLERYIPVEVDESNYSFYFVSPDKKTVAMMRLTASGKKILYVIIYVPASSSRGDINLIEEFQEGENIPSDCMKITFEELKERF